MTGPICTLAGISTGTTLSLLAASMAELAERVSMVAAVAPFTDLEKVIMLATTGQYRSGDGLEPYSPPPYLLVALTRSLAATLPPGPLRDALCDELRALDGKLDRAARAVPAPLRGGARSRGGRTPRPPHEP